MKALVGATTRRGFLCDCENIGNESFAALPMMQSSQLYEPYFVPEHSSLLRCTIIMMASKNAMLGLNIFGLQETREKDTMLSNTVKQ